MRTATWVFRWAGSWGLLAVLGCSGGESAVVGGNDNSALQGAGASPAQEGGQVKRTLTEITNAPDRCLPGPLPRDADGTAACKVFALSTDGSCACDGANRTPTTDAIRDTVVERARRDGLCDGADGPNCEEACVCENLEATGDSLDACLAGAEEADGWCYVVPDAGIGSAPVECDTDFHGQVRFAGTAQPNKEEQLFLACSETSQSVGQKLALGSVCVASEEQYPAFSGFALDEVVVDTGSDACASGICLVEGFQGRVTCPLGSPAGEGACAIPGSGQRVLVEVQSQLIARPPSVASTCSCRCAGPGPGPFCSCTERQICAPLIADFGLPGDDLAGSYCVPAGAVVDPSTLPPDVCADDPAQCSADRPQ
jgi:hypothetical protein